MLQMKGVIHWSQSRFETVYNLILLKDIWFKILERLSLFRFRIERTA